MELCSKFEGALTFRSPLRVVSIGKESDLGKGGLNNAAKAADDALFCNLYFLLVFSVKDADVVGDNDDDDVSKIESVLRFWSCVNTLFFGLIPKVVECGVCGSNLKRW